MSFGGSWSGIVLLAGTLLLPPGAEATKYRVDGEHSTVAFRIRHLFSQVTGRFDRFDGTIAFDPDKVEATKVEGSIDVASINTNQVKRDQHLRSNDFFDVEQFPQITFVSTGVTRGSDGMSGTLEGTLTIHGVAKRVTLEVSYLGEGTDPWGKRRAGFNATTTINRKDFGLDWNKALEAGGLLVGDEVQIQIDAEALVEP